MELAGEKEVQWSESSDLSPRCELIKALLTLDAGEATADQEATRSPKTGDYLMAFALPQRKP